MDRPVQRQFNPMAEKTGVDRVTQVDENDPELFNFDYEVQPILEVRSFIFRLCSIRYWRQVEWSYMNKGKCNKNNEKRSNMKSEGIQSWPKLRNWKPTKTG